MLKLFKKKVGKAEPVRVYRVEAEILFNNGDKHLTWETGSKPRHPMSVKPVRDSWLWFYKSERPLFVASGGNGEGGWGMYTFKRGDVSSITLKGYWEDKK